MGSTSSTSKGLAPDPVQLETSRKKQSPSSSPSSSDKLKESFALDEDLKSLRFFKAAIGISFLSFSFFDVDSHRPSLSGSIRRWASFASQIQSIVVGVEAVVHFTKLRELLKSKEKGTMAWNFSYIKGICEYSAIWLAMLFFSGSLNSILEALLVLFFPAFPSEIKTGFLLDIDTVLLQIQSIVLIATFVFLLTSGMGRRALSSAPWVALLVFAIANDFSERIKNASDLLNERSISFDDLYAAHLKELGSPLGSGSVALTLGALCGIFIMRERCSSKSSYWNVNENGTGSVYSNEVGNSGSSGKGRIGSWKLLGDRRKLVSYLRSSIMLLTSLFFIMSSYFVTDSNFLYLDLRLYGSSFTSAYWFLMELLHKSSWAYAIFACTVRSNSAYSNAHLRAIAQNRVWKLFAQFVYPLFVVVTYNVFEYLVAVPFFGFSLQRLFILFLTCIVIIWLLGGNNNDDMGILDDSGRKKGNHAKNILPVDDEHHHSKNEGQNM